MADKIRCCKCGKIAVWAYMPGDGDDHYYCDDCVPRGCSCNVDNLDEFPYARREPDDNGNMLWWSKETYEKHWKNEGDLEKYATRKRMSDSFYYEVLDEKGRRMPCGEFDYSPDGFDEE